MTHHTDVARSASMALDGGKCNYETSKARVGHSPRSYSKKKGTNYEGRISWF